MTCRFCSAKMLSPDKHLKRCLKFHVCLCGFEVSCGWNIAKKHPDLKEHERACLKYKEFRSSVNVSNGRRGYERIVERGGVEEWKRSIGEAVSRTISSNQSEIERRRELAKSTITAWARSEEGRRISSETASRTATRPDIVRSRSKVLANWREANPEKFYELCTKQCQKFVSKPQKLLFELCRKIDPGFKHNQRIWNTRFTTVTKRRQIDILHRKKMIVVEFDGPYHFRMLRKEQRFEETQTRDRELNDVLASIGYCVVRVSIDEFDYRKGGTFSSRVLDVLRSVVDNPKPGLHLVGESYDQDRF